MVSALLSHPVYPVPIGRVRFREPDDLSKNTWSEAKSVRSRKKGYEIQITPIIASANASMFASGNPAILIRPSPTMYIPCSERSFSI